MTSNVSQVFIDDSDTRVQYEAGWTYEQDVVAVDETRHIAAAAPLWVQLPFSGEFSVSTSRRTCVVVLLYITGVRHPLARAHL